MLETARNSAVVSVVLICSKSRSLETDAVRSWVRGASLGGAGVSPQSAAHPGRIDRDRGPSGSPFEPVIATRPHPAKPSRTRKDTLACRPPYSGTNAILPSTQNADANDSAPATTVSART